MGTVKKSSGKSAPRHGKATAPPGGRDLHGSEREADEQRPGGPRFHGAGWQRADEEKAHGGEDLDAPRADDPDRVEDGEVPGARGRKPATGTHTHH